MKLHRPRTYWRMVRRLVYGPHVAERQVFHAVNKVHGRVFLDIGANIGMYSIPLAKNFMEVYSFEPDYKAGNILRQKTSELKNVHIVDSAVSNVNGQARLYRDPLYPTPNPPTGSASTILDEWHYKPGCLPHIDIFYRGKDYSEVKTITLDSFAEYYLNRIRWIDLVKIDVEGAEFLVLEGARALLKEARITRLMVELHDRDRRKELVNLLEGYGYRGRWIDVDHYYAEYWPRTKTREEAFLESREPVSHSAYQ